jgi:hypothetical protein
VRAFRRNRGRKASKKGKRIDPDVVATCSPADVPMVAKVIWQIADGLAQGLMPASPRHGVDLPEGTWCLTADEEDRAATLLALNNDARLLVDEANAPLVGITDRIAAGGCARASQLPATRRWRGAV